MGNWNNDKTAYISTEDEVEKFRAAIPRVSFDVFEVTTKFVCAYCGKHISGPRGNLNVRYENGAIGRHAYPLKKTMITGTKKDWLNGRYGLQTLGKTFCWNYNVNFDCKRSYFQKNNILTNEAKIRADEEKKAAEERAEKERKWAETSDLINGIFYSKDHLAVNGAQQNIQDAKILDGVTTIKLKAFYECKKLRSIEIPETAQT